MKLARGFKLGIIAFASILMIYSGNALTQSSQQGDPYEIQITNVCSSGTITLSLISLEAEGALFPISFTVTNQQLQPGQSYTLNGSTTVTPTRLRIQGSFGGQGYSAVFDPLMFNVPQNDTSTFGGCLQALVTFGASDGGTQQPPSGSKPIAQGQSFDQVLSALGSSGFQITIDGSEANPKIGNVNDPQLLRMAPAFSAQVIWVSAPGQLRSAINWDNSNVDLDLLVFGIGACFQLNGTGIIAEVCDRFPSGPVPGNIFAVIVINWSAINQAFVLSLSS